MRLYPAMGYFLRSQYAGVSTQGSGVRGQYAGVRSWSSELELESGGGDFSWRVRSRRWSEGQSGNEILTVVPSPILLDIVIFPPSSAVRRSMPESP